MDVNIKYGELLNFKEMVKQDELPHVSVEEEKKHDSIAKIKKQIR